MTKPYKIHIQAQDGSGLVHIHKPGSLGETLCGIKQRFGYWYDVGGRKRITCEECKGHV